MTVFDARQEAAEIICQWSGIVWEEGIVLELARDQTKAEEMLRLHSEHFDPPYSDEDIKEIARWIARAIAH
jgi:hypothetical protein